MTVSITDLYQILADKIGKDEAKALTSFVEEKIEQQVEQKATILATKADLLDSERSINTKLWIPPRPQFIKQIPVQKNKI
jgi:hypothetical protein